VKVEEYRALQAQKPRRNDDPEHQFQCAVVLGLHEVLPPQVRWTANAAGVRVTPATARKMKEAGVQRGWGDLQFLFPDLITRYIELKRGAVLSAEQKGFRAAFEPMGIWAIARTWDEVEEPLARWCEACRLVLRPLHPITRQRLRAFA
jgi:hypothetical protein